MTSILNIGKEGTTGSLGKDLGKNSLISMSKSNFLGERLLLSRLQRRVKLERTVLRKRMRVSKRDYRERLRQLSFTGMASIIFRCTKDSAALVVKMEEPHLP